jgi:hypothetical protein
VKAYRLDKAALTPLLSKRPEVMKEMCRLLSEHRASDQSLLAMPPPAASDSSGFLDWLREGVKRFHELTS